MKTEFGNAKINNSGYYVITSRKEGYHKKLLHRLIYEKYIGEIPDGFIVHHLDENKLNNNLDNLVLMDVNEHRSYHMTGEKNPQYGKISPFRGKHHSEETKKKFSEFHKGLKASEETKLKMRKSRKKRVGEKAPNWKGYATVSKGGFYKDKQKYNLRYQGKVITSSIDYAKLKRLVDCINVRDQMMIEPCVEACLGVDCDFFKESMENKCSIRKQIIEKENKELAEAEPKETIDVKEILATDKWLRELDNQSFGFALTNEVIEEEVVRVGKR